MFKPKRFSSTERLFFIACVLNATQKNHCALFQCCKPVTSGLGDVVVDRCIQNVIFFTQFVVAHY